MLAARRARLGAAALLATAIAIGCGGSRKPAPPPVSPVTRSWIDKAEDEERMRHHNRAELLYLRAKRESPDDHSRAFAAGQYAATLIHWGELERARRELTEATRLDPTRAGYWHYLGHVEHQLGNPEPAEAALRRSVEIAPRVWHYRRSLSALFVEQRRYHEAIGQLQAMLDLDIPPEIRDSIVHKALPMLRAAEGTGAPR